MLGASSFEPTGIQNSAFSAHERGVRLERRPSAEEVGSHRHLPLERVAAEVREEPPSEDVGILELDGAEVAEEAELGGGDVGAQEGGRRRAFVIPSSSERW